MDFSEGAATVTDVKGDGSRLHARQPQAADHHHDTHAVPPQFVHQAYWHYQTIKRADLDRDEQVIDFGRGLTAAQADLLQPVGRIPASTVERTCRAYREAALGADYSDDEEEGYSNDVTIYEHREFPGLQIIPGLLPPATQVLFTSQLLHRDLANRMHKTNLQPDYTIPYPPPRKHQQEEQQQQQQKIQPTTPEEGATRTPTTTEDAATNPPTTTAPSPCSSFFTLPRESPSTLLPKNPTTHAPLSTAQFLSTKLRWLTLGTQYDWPTRSYSSTAQTPFPSDLALLVTGFFPHIRPESGVVLLYSNKGYMPVHRDVSEQCVKPLASFSLGCEGAFVIARGGEGEGDGEAVGEDKDDMDKGKEELVVVIRVRSGDCIHLDGEARWAWHAMARTVPGTCPDFLAEWPVGTPGATEEEGRLYAKWKGYMASKRLNVSCRQVWD